MVLCIEKILNKDEFFPMPLTHQTKKNKDFLVAQCKQQHKKRE